MSEKKRFNIKLLLLFLVYEIFFIGVSTPFIILYGPTTNIKKIIVSTVMGTRHKYLITTFLSQAEIDELTNANAQNTTTSDSAIQDSIEKQQNAINVKYKNKNDITEYDIKSQGRYNAYLLEIKDPTKVKVAFANKLGIHGQKTSEMAKAKDALAAINGGSFSDKGSIGGVSSSQGSVGATYGGAAAYPGGFVIANGKLEYPDVSGNDTKQCVIAFAGKNSTYSEGTLVIGKHSANELMKNNVTQAVCFEDSENKVSTLIVNGKGLIKDQLTGGFNPRTAIGQKADGTVLFLVADGRKGILQNSGASYYDLQQILLDHGAQNAAILDGGYSSTMYYDEDIINSLNGWSGERYVATALYVEP